MIGNDTLNVAGLCVYQNLQDSQSQSHRESPQNQSISPAFIAITVFVWSSWLRLCGGQWRINPRETRRKAYPEYRLDNSVHNSQH